MTTKGWFIGSTKRILANVGYIVEKRDFHAAPARYEVRNLFDIRNFRDSSATKAAYPTITRGEMSNTNLSTPSSIHYAKYQTQCPKSCAVVCLKEQSA